MTDTQWRAKKDAPTDGTPIIIWHIYSSGMLYGARFGEIEHGGEVHGRDGSHSIRSPSMKATA